MGILLTLTLRHNTAIDFLSNSRSRLSVGHHILEEPLAVQVQVQTQFFDEPQLNLNLI